MSLINFFQYSAQREEQYLVLLFFYLMFCDCGIKMTQYNKEVVCTIPQSLVINLAF